MAISQNENQERRIEKLILSLSSGVIMGSVKEYSGRPAESQVHDPATPVAVSRAIRKNAEGALKTIEVVRGH